MERSEWPFEPSSSAALAASDEIFTLPPTVSSSSIWHEFNVDVLPTFPNSQEPSFVQTESAKPDDDVSDATDAQISTSPTTTRLDPSAASPFITQDEQQIASDLEHNKLKPRATIAKPKPGFMPALSIGVGRSILKDDAITTVKVKTEKSPAVQKRPADESSRQRHNQMMRENRGRFNKKFRELTELLHRIKAQECEDKPMKNKIQILERAMCQYALMESERARFKNELLFAPPNPPAISTHEMEVIASAPNLEGACELVVRSMCGSLDWKYGEVWTRKTGNAQGSELTLQSAFVSPKNMAGTRRALQGFAQKASGRSIDRFFLKISQYKQAIWIPNLSSKQDVCARAKDAAEAGITTMLSIPVVVNSHSTVQPDAIIVLMHADDDLLSFSNGIRSYHSESLCRLTDLSSAVAQTRSHLT